MKWIAFYLFFVPIPGFSQPFDGFIPQGTVHVSFRLPTNDEWELATRLLSDTLAFSKPISYSIEAYLRSDNPKYALSLVPDSTKSVNRLKKALSNHKRNDSIPSFILNREYPWYALIEDKLPINVYFPEEFDVADKQYLPLNMIGNVAE